MGQPRIAGNEAAANRADDVAARVWLAIALASILGAIVLTVVVASRIAIPFDAVVLRDVVGAVGSNPLWNVMSEVGNYPMIPIAVIFVVALLFRRRRREALVVVVILVGATVASEGIKALVARDRPLGSAPGIPGSIYSYPSGHAFEDVAILGTIAWRLWRSAVATWLRVGFACLVVAEALLVGVARVALDLHYPSDVLGGYLGGLASLGLYAWATRPGSWADHPPLDGADANATETRAMRDSRPRRA